MLKTWGTRIVVVIFLLAGLYAAWFYGLQGRPLYYRAVGYITRDAAQMVQLFCAPRVESEKQARELIRNKQTKFIEVQDQKQSVGYSGFTANADYSQVGYRIWYRSVMPGVWQITGCRFVGVEDIAQPVVPDLLTKPISTPFLWDPELSEPIPLYTPIVPYWKPPPRLPTLDARDLSPYKP